MYNCQNRDYGLWIRDPFSNNQSFKYNYITANNDSSVTINSTKANSTISTYINFHYYDARFGKNINSYDQAVLIRIINNTLL